MTSFGRPRRILALCAALAALVLPATAHATTYVSGTLPAGAVWTLAGSPYVVDRSAKVGAGRTLTIEPGVVVKFNGQLGTLWVDGSLSAVGTPEQRIVFTWSDIFLGKSPPNGPVNYATYVLPGSDPPQKCAPDYVLDVPHSDSPYFP